MLTVSIVSHGNGVYVNQLLSDLARCQQVTEVILVNNISDQSLRPQKYPFNLRIINNIDIYGYGENNNIAFGLVTTPFFCVLNPDIRILENPFEQLINKLLLNQYGVIAPKIKNMNGDVTSSGGKLPNFFSTITKLFLKKKMLISVVEEDEPEFLCGMFMLFASSTFRKIGGFNKRYFLYYEDVDICWRLKLELGLKSAWLDQYYVFHVGQLSSHHYLKYFIIHVHSFFRWNFSYLLRLRKRRIHARSATRLSD